jgi:hypothetical protein
MPFGINVPLPAPLDTNMTNLVADWSALPTPPSFLNRTTLRKASGLAQALYQLGKVPTLDKSQWYSAGTSNARIRPYAPLGGFSTFDGMVARVLNTQFSNYIVTGTPPASAVQFNAEDPDVFRTLPDGSRELATMSLLEVGYCEFFNIYRAGLPGHSDAVWAAGSSRATKGVNMWLHHLFTHHCGGSCMPILADQSEWGVVLIDNYILQNMPNMGFIKAHGKLLVIANSPGFACDIMGQWDEVVVYNCPNSRIGSSAGVSIKRPTTYNLPAFDTTTGKVTLSAAGGTAVSPPSVWTAPTQEQWNATQATLRTLTAEKAELLSEKATLTAANDALRTSLNTALNTVSNYASRLDRIKVDATV